MSETHWKQNFNYRYTGAYELKPGETKTVTINRTCTEEVMNTNGKKELCFVAYFTGNEKPMVLNKTNCKTIEKMYGPFVEKWIGRSIILESKKVKAFGETVDALRVKHSVPKQTGADYSADEQRLNGCRTIEELASVYISLSRDAKAALLLVKDRMKGELEGGGNEPV
jgi:hypothetical protein